MHDLKRVLKKKTQFLDEGEIFLLIFVLSSYSLVQGWVWKLKFRINVKFIILVFDNFSPNTCN